MLTEEYLKELLHKPGLSKLEQLLLCLALNPDKPKQIKEIRGIAVNAGLRAAKGWNLADILGKSEGKAINTSKGWELRDDGRKAVGKLGVSFAGSSIAPVATALRAQMGKIKNPRTQDFVQEAIMCFEGKLYRAAIVLAWVGAVSVLYTFIINKKLSEFNVEAARRNPKWKPATTEDDLAELPEYEFLQIIHAISVVGKSVKHQLEGGLKLRNGCGHPNSLVVGEHTAASHIETLLLNVFEKFSI